MAVIFACGFEVGDLNYYNLLSGPSFLNLEAIVGSQVTVVTTVNRPLHRRSDGSGGKFCGFSTGNWAVRVLPSTPRWVHFYFKRRSDATSNPTFYAEASTNLEQCNVLFDLADNKVKIRRSTTVLATSVGTFDPASGYYVTLEIVVDNAAGLVRVYLNDSPTAFVEVTGVDTQQQTIGDFTGFMWGGGAAARLFVDDILITDATTGRVAESFGILGRPVSNRETVSTPSTGTNWENVRPSSLFGGINPSGVSRYNEITSTGQDLYNVVLDSYINPSSAVATVVTHVLGAATGALVGQTLVRSGGTTGNTASFGVPRSYGPTVHYWNTDPNTGVAWQPNALFPSNLSVGLKTL